jgi:hypothetical protein
MAPVALEAGGNDLCVNSESIASLTCDNFIMGIPQKLICSADGESPQGYFRERTYILAVVEQFYQKLEGADKF